MAVEKYSQKIGNWISTNTGCSILDLCRKFGYYDTALKIMAIDDTDVTGAKRTIASNHDLKTLYIASSKDKKALTRKGENRTWTQYFKDLITGWILEDLTIEMMRRQGIDVSKNGNDSNRIIDIGNSVSQDADLKVTIGEYSRKIELSNEFNSILSTDGFIEKRAPSLYKLWKDRGIWVYRDIPRGKYVLVDFYNEDIVLHIRNHNTIHNNWSKDVHRYVLTENNKHERDDRLLTSEIIAIVGCKLDEQVRKCPKEIIDADSLPTQFKDGVFSQDGLYKELYENNKKRDNANIVETTDSKTSKPSNVVAKKSIEAVHSSEENVNHTETAVESNQYSIEDDSFV